MMLKNRFTTMMLGILMLLPAALALQAQTPAAPLPAQILTAKKVFISNASGDYNPYLWSGGPARSYNEFYAAMKRWGKYELVSAPGEADLVIEIDFNANPNAPEFKAVLLDPKTHIVLWTLDEYVQPGIVHLEDRDKYLGVSINRLVDDLKTLTAQPAAVAQ